jgi:ubiquinone/menaquinone biosynthesis C-methylase UbiE
MALPQQAITGSGLRSLEEAPCFTATVLSTIMARPPLFNRQTERVARHFEASAGRFAKRRWVLDREITSAYARELADRPKLLVLDVGAGPGILCQRLRRLYPHHTYLGCDLSRSMVTRGAESGLVSAIADMHQLPFADGSADTILVRQSLHYSHDLMRSLTELRRVLKPDGRLLLGQFTPRNRSEQRWANLMLQIRRPIVTTYPTIDQWLRLLASSGFDIVRHHSIPVKESLGSWLNRYPASPEAKCRVRALFDHRQGCQFPRIWAVGKDLRFVAWFSFLVLRPTVVVQRRNPASGERAEL